MKQKSELLEKFKEYEAMANNITGKKIKAMRSDSGGEYTSKAFNNYLQMKGIQRQFTIPRNPEQSGVAECMYRTLQETVRSMILGAGLIYEFWAEAILSAAILKHSSPTTAINGVTHYECFMGSKTKCVTFKSFLDEQLTCK